MNVLNVEDIERELRRYAARAYSEHAKRWVMTVARNYLLGGLPEKDLIANYRTFTPHKTQDPAYIHAEDISFIVSMRNGLPAWANTALERGETLMWFDPIQVRRRELWNVLEVIVLWFNNWKKEDTRFPRVDRISFPVATNAAVLWYKDVSTNIWNYVTDKPYVIATYEHGYRWVKLVTALQFEREGRLMNHCVGNGNYYNTWRMSSAKEYYSLRDKNNMPHVTLEVSDARTAKGSWGLVLRGCVQQCKGNSNRKPDRQYQPFVLRFIKEMKWEVRGDGSHIEMA